MTEEGIKEKDLLPIEMYKCKICGRRYKPYKDALGYDEHQPKDMCPDCEHKNLKARNKKDLAERIAQIHEDMDLRIAEIALEYAIMRKKEDMVSGEDSSVYYGRVTRGGPFLYPEGWKNKDYNNLKENFQKTSHLPIFGSRVYGSHNEEKPTTHLVGFSTDWEYDDPNKDIFGYQYFFDDVKKLSNLKNPIELPVSIKFDDVGHGNRQEIAGLHHLAVSLNKLEDDRCGLEGGKACTISPVGLSKKTGQISDSNDSDTSTSTSTDSSTLEEDISHNGTGRDVHYKKLNNSEISKEAIDMTKKETSPGAGKPTPNKNEIGSDIEKCADGEKTEEECKMEQKRKERTGKWDGEVSGKVNKDLEEMDITLEDLTALIEENEELKQKLDSNEKETSDLESKVNSLIKWQAKKLKEEDTRIAGELEVIKKDLVDNHNTCEKFIESHLNYDFLSEFHKGLPHEEADITTEEDDDGIIPTSLADMGKKLEDMAEKFAYMRMS